MLELQAPEMVFIPSLDFNVPDGFYDLVDGLVGDIYKQASLIKRLAAHSGQVYIYIYMALFFIHFLKNKKHVWLTIYLF